MTINSILNPIHLYELRAPVAPTSQVRRQKTMPTYISTYQVISFQTKDLSITESSPYYTKQQSKSVSLHL